MAKRGLTAEDRLRGALRGMSRAPWHVMAGLMRQALGPGGGDSEAVRTAAREVTGLSWGLLTRYLNVLGRVETAASFANVSPSDLISPGFNGVEVAVRLFDRSPELGIAALRGLRDGRTTVAEVRDRLARAPAGAADADVVARSRLLRRNAAEIQAVEDAVEADRGKLFPKDSIIRRRRGLLYFRRIGMEVLSPDGAPLHGLDVVTASSRERESLDAGLAQSVLLSTFFPRFHLVFSPGADPSAIDEAGTALDMLGVQWIGILRASADGRLEVVRKPKGSPVPDRSSLYGALVSELAVGRTSGPASDPTEIADRSASWNAGAGAPPRRRR